MMTRYEAKTKEKIMITIKYGKWGKRLKSINNDNEKKEFVVKKKKKY